MLKALYTHRIQEVVEDFKKVMGIAIAPTNTNHMLYPLFLEYERNTSLLALRYLNPPDAVIELATYAYSVLLFRRCWQGKNFSDLRRRLNDSHEAQ